MRSCDRSTFEQIIMIQTWRRGTELQPNILRPRQNSRYFADDTFKRIFMNGNVRISINFSLKFVPKGLINNIPALVQIMAWRRPGDKTLSEPMMVNLLTHLCVTRPQWVNLKNNRSFSSGQYYTNQDIRVNMLKMTITTYIYFCRTEREI